MKKVRFIVCALMALVLFSCEKTPAVTPDNDPIKWLPESIFRDFSGRYPEAAVVSVSGDRETEYVRISLLDKDGFKSEVVYRNGEWMASEKRLDVNDFLSSLPEPVYKTYLKTGIGHEVFYKNSNYVIEIARNGFPLKQYEIDCIAPYLDGDEWIEGFYYHIVIAEDGTLLVCDHHSTFNPTIGMADIGPALADIRERYGNVSLVGVVDDGGYANVFIREEGIVKKVTFKTYRKDFEVADFEWRQTEYALPMDLPLPGHVLKTIEEYEFRHSGKKWSGLSMLETVSGFFYGLTFGTEVDNNRFYVGIDVLS